MMEVAFLFSEVEVLVTDVMFFSWKLYMMVVVMEMFFFSWEV